MTLNIDNELDLVDLKETVDVEFKLAEGKDGNGAVPKSLWETYSAMANTMGGEIFLGVKEAHGKFDFKGVKNPEKIIADLWNILNNSQKVSINLLKNADIQIININGVGLIRLHIPKASRKQKPVYINNNPVNGTFRRYNEGDYRCDEEVVRRMMAEQIEDARDSRILKGYTFDDLDIDSLRSYRQLLSATKPDHPWNNHDSTEFLRCIGGWRRDRETGEEGLTLAGLLMFGRLPSIQEALPNYLIDYQERPEPKKETRWIDRLTLDGTWSGNLFDFYRRVIRKLTDDIKVPFHLEADQRKDESSVHVALREALVNTLVHADFSGRVSVLVVKRPDMFGFRNPGLMRVPVEQAIRGGESDCRNRTIHQMFMLIGLGERAGSGVPKIFSSWKSQHWRKPMLYEKAEPDQTLMELRMFDLIPAEVVQNLHDSLGSKFEQLSELEQLILVTASIESVIRHSRIMEITDVHPHDLTIAFTGLVKQELLESDGVGRGTVYFLPGTDVSATEDAFAFQVIDYQKLMRPVEAPEVGAGGPEVGTEGPEVGTKGPEVTEEEVILVSGISDIEEHRALKSIAEPVSNKKRAPRAEVERVILELCNGRYLSIRALEILLNRSGEFLRKDYLNPMVRSNMLSMRYPTKPNHPEQAYIAKRK